MLTGKTRRETHRYSTDVKFKTEEKDGVLHVYLRLYHYLENSFLRLEDCLVLRLRDHIGTMGQPAPQTLVIINILKY